MTWMREQDNYHKFPATHYYFLQFNMQKTTAPRAVTFWLQIIHTTERQHLVLFPIFKVFLGSRVRQMHLACGPSDSRQNGSNLTLPTACGLRALITPAFKSSAILSKGVSHNKGENLICYGLTDCSDSILE